MTTTTFGHDTVNAERLAPAAGLFGRVRTFLARSLAERQLAQLDDRMLADIGLKRSEISRMVWGN